MSRLGHRLRERIAQARSRDGQHGQVIVLLALSLVALLLVAGLVLDVARVYTVTRYERSVADAAALAGAQDLQVLDSTGNPTNSPPGSTQYTRAQTDALALLVRELGGTSTPSACPSWSSSATTCTALINGTYTVAITTPYPGDPTKPNGAPAYPDRAVKVAISQPFHLTFGNLVCLLPGTGCASGAPVWNPTVASVAELFKQPQYALMTLQPGGNFCTGGGTGTPIDLQVSGSGSDGTFLNVVQGDVGTNTTACTSPNTGVRPSRIILASGYDIYTYQPLPTTLSQYWYQGVPTPGVPAGRRLSSLIKDPFYYSSLGTSPLGTLTYAGRWASQSDGETTTCTGYLPESLATATPDVTWTCYKPGYYSGAFKVAGSGGGGSAKGAYLLPGAYYFDNGLSVNSGNYLAGGVASGSEGVALVFPESSASRNFSTASGSTVLLNVGDVKLDSTGSVVPASTEYATAAKDASSTPIKIQTPQGWPLTVIVVPDNSCFNTDHTPVVPPCSTAGNQVVQLTGNPTLQIAGVIYGPSDNMAITSNGTSQIGGNGQIVSYTISYGGGAQLTQTYPQGPTNDVLRLATVCSPGVVCP